MSVHDKVDEMIRAELRELAAATTDQLPAEIAALMDAAGKHAALAAAGANSREDAARVAFISGVYWERARAKERS
jgi:hypothetical protein